MTDTASPTGRLTENVPPMQPLPSRSPGETYAEYEKRTRNVRRAADQLPSLRELQREEARRQVADGTLPLATAKHHFPDVTDWPEPGAVEPELTPHQRELVRNLQLTPTDGAAFAYGYLETFVKIVLASGDLGQLRRHYDDLTTAREYVKRQR